MGKERWDQIQALYHATAERQPSQREEFLSQACRNDPELRREVESLLVHEGQADGLFESPAWKQVGPGDPAASTPRAMATGSQLGVFRIVELLGTGGMGEVYRATDTRLHRDVAIKVLPAEYAHQPEWLSRFHREARALASLNHPCIAAIYGLEESGGICALAMELAEGATLAARIERGPMALESALAIAKQLAEALEYAHEKGIVHRDLKPANVKITREGAVKVLDFGLAKATQRSVAPGDLTDAPTVTATTAGAILGTPAYMPPEQAKGEFVDQRADIWAFGVVVFEMLSGRRLYPQKSMTETLAAVMRDEPRWEELPANTPAAIRKLLERCLEKDSKRRLRDIGEARIAIEDFQAGKVDASGSERAPKRRLPSVAVAAVLAAALLVTGVEFTRLRFPARPLPPQTVRFRIPVPEGMTLPQSESFSLSPDGKILAYLASNSDGVLGVWVQSLDSLKPRLLPGTDIRGGDPPPFWSPDSRFLAYYSGLKLKKTDLTGSLPVTICNTPGITIGGGSWSRQGVIIFGNEMGGLMRVPENGGNAAPLTMIDRTRGERVHGFPTILPDGRHFIYSRVSNVLENSGVYVGSLDVPPSEQGLKQLLATQYRAKFVPQSNGNGRLLFLRDGALWVQDLDTSRLDLVGDPVKVAEPVGNYLVSGFFDASAGDALVYRNPTGQLSQLAWFDRQGKRLASVGTPIRPESGLALSPDGTRVALALFDGTGVNLWVYDLVRDVRQRLTVDPDLQYSALWSADGKRLVFSSNRSGHFDSYQIAASGEGSAELLYASDDNKTPTSWSPDGKFLAYETRAAVTNRDVWVLPLEGTGKRTAVPLLRTVANESSGAFSPAGRWIAYDSDYSGNLEVYVQAFDPAVSGYLSGPKILVSVGGGLDPHWRADGKELFYHAQGGVMSVTVPAGTTFQPGAPHRLFPRPKGWLGEPEGDGKRFLFAVPVEQTAPQPFTMVLNWQAELKK